MDGQCQREYRYKSTIAGFDVELLNRETEFFCASDEQLLSKLFTIQLVLEELVTNIIKYGSKKEIENEETIEAKLCIGNGKVVLTVSDNTEAFNPLDAEVPDITLPVQERKIGGLGLLLIQKLVQSISYDRKDGWNIVKAII